MRIRAFSLFFINEKQKQGYLIRLYGFLLEKDLNVAEEAVNAIEKGISFLREFPFSCRKADSQNPFLRELLISFGNSGYVALFEIENSHTITVLAVRHLREDDYL